MSQEQEFQKQGMLPVDIKIALMRKGVTQTAIADKCKVSLSTVQNVIKGRVRYKMHGRSKPIMLEISRILDKQVSEIWDLSE